ncbi:MAG: LysR family transcriptional regulator [Lachnospiraceae bacterium]|nr:LysR family transcriptional regulator [Lachnospiraceae bacterium]
MTLQQLEYFSTLSKILHYSKAAEALHTSQPNLSYAIKELEKELGVPLFRKTGRNIVLSEYGLQFAAYAEDALSSISMGKNALFHMTDHTDTLALDYIEDAGMDFIPSLLHDFSLKNPDVTFRLYQAHNSILVRRMLDEISDLAFAIENPDYPMITSRTIVEQEMVLCVPPAHPLSRRSSISLTEIVLEPIAVFSRSTGVRRIVDNMCEEASIHLNIAYECEDIIAAYTYVAAGFAVAITPRTAIAKNFRVVEIPIIAPLRTRSLCLQYNSAHSLPRAALRFMDFVSERFPLSASS